MGTNALKYVSKKKINTLRAVRARIYPSPILSRSSDRQNGMFDYTVYNCFGFKNNIAIRIISSRVLSLKRNEFQKTFHSSNIVFNNHSVLASCLNGVLR